METLITILQVIALFLLVAVVDLLLIAGICWLGSRNVEASLAANLRDGYVPRIGDHPSQRYARRQEDHVRAQFLAECE